LALICPEFDKEMKLKDIHTGLRVPYKHTKLPTRKCFYHNCGHPQRGVYKGYKKSKVIPLQARCGPDGWYRCVYLWVSNVLVYVSVLNTVFLSVSCSLPKTGCGTGEET